MTTSRARPVAVQVRLTPAERDTLHTAATDAGCSMGLLLRVAMREWLRTQPEDARELV